MTSTTPPHHIPSAGLTLETLKALPPSPDAWFPPHYGDQQPSYRPTIIYYNWYPSRYYGARNFAVYPYGMGGVYPQMNLLPRTSIGWLFW